LFAKELHPRESKLKKKRYLTDSLLIPLSKVFHHLYKSPVASASTPTTDQLEPVPELSYLAVCVVIWQRGMPLWSALQLLFDLNSESMMAPKKIRNREGGCGNYNDGLKGKM